MIDQISQHIDSEPVCWWRSEVQRAQQVKVIAQSIQVCLFDFGVLSIYAGMIGNDSPGYAANLLVRVDAVLSPSPQRYRQQLKIYRKRAVI